MDSNLARRQVDDSSSLMTEKNFQHKITPQRISRSEGTELEGSDSKNFVSDLTATPKRCNSLQASSIETPNVTSKCIGEKEGRGETPSLRFDPSHNSSVTPSKDFIGTPERFKHLLHSVLTKAVASTLAPTTSPSSRIGYLRKQGDQSLSEVGREGEFTPSIDAVMTGNDCLLQKLVEEKQTDCVALQQKVDSKNSEIAQFQSIIEGLRESKKQQASNVERLRIALKQASQNATTAREKANKAEADGTSLMMRVQAFETVVQETKRASALLSQEQEEIRVGVELMENERMQLHATINSHDTMQQKMLQEKQRLSQQLESSKSCVEEVQDTLEREQSEHLSLKRKYEELEMNVHTQENQCKKLQEDLDSAQALLLDSTSAAAESNVTLKDCKQVIGRLEEANRHLHEKLLKNQSTLRKQEASHLDAMNLVKKNLQEVKLELSNQKQEFRALRLEKLAADKRQESQEAKIIALERRLRESTNLMTTTSSFPSASQHPNGNYSGNDKNTNGNDRTVQDSNFTNIGEKNSKEIDGIAVPQLKKNNLQTSQKVKQCSICLKQSSGLMKKCDCGKGCKFRAHATCVQQKFGAISRAGLDPNDQQVSAAVILCHPPNSDDNIP